MNPICALVLAAGTSSRMGYPKPLLQWNGTTLLEYQVSQLLKLPFSEITVVLGHESEMIRNQVDLDEPRVKLTKCQNYREGLSSSLKFGLQQVTEHCDAVMIMLVDLPLIRVETIKRVFDKGADLLSRRSEAFAVQPRYQKQNGHPVFLGHIQKLNWHDLKGDEGAKRLIQRLQHHLLLETDDLGVIDDVDTPEAYRKALANFIFQKR